MALAVEIGMDEESEKMKFSKLSLKMKILVIFCSFVLTGVCGFVCWMLAEATFTGVHYLANDQALPMNGDCRIHVEVYQLLYLVKMDGLETAVRESENPSDQAIRKMTQKQVKKYWDFMNKYDLYKAVVDKETRFNSYCVFCAIFLICIPIIFLLNPNAQKSAKKEFFQIFVLIFCFVYMGLSFYKIYELIVTDCSLLFD
uniref:Uncharacterized protein n=1 Tax=Panagrolaimus sp. JU765 TaxID=591449 RepID=A0AC34R3X8_9BILA